MEKESDTIVKCKVVLLGESGVGKTSIINRYINNVFRSNFIPSSSSSFSTKTVDLTKEFKKSIKFEIWDTAGQEKYKSINKIFYKDADVCILVYDITRKDSYEVLTTLWLNELKERLRLSQVLVCFCANKIDLYEYQEVNENIVNEYCNDNEYIFKETSAQNGHGIDDMFKSIAIKLLDPYYEHNEEVNVESKIKSIVNIDLDNKENANNKKKKCC